MSAQQASLQTTGVAGYFAVLDNLSPGSHQLISSVVQPNGTFYHVDNIVVGART
jgi:hypothetical protein